MHGDRDIEKREPLTGAIIVGWTRLKLRAANSDVSWHSLAGHAEEEARETSDREGWDGLQGLPLSIVMPVPMRSSVKWSREISVSKYPDGICYGICRPRAATTSLCTPRCGLEEGNASSSCPLDWPEFPRVLRTHFAPWKGACDVAANLCASRESWRSKLRRGEVPIGRAKWNVDTFARRGATLCILSAIYGGHSTRWHLVTRAHLRDSRRSTALINMPRGAGVYFTGRADIWSPRTSTPLSPRSSEIPARYSLARVFIMPPSTQRRPLVKSSREKLHRNSPDSRAASSQRSILKVYVNEYI